MSSNSNSNSNSQIIEAVAQKNKRTGETLAVIYRYASDTDDEWDSKMEELMMRTYGPKVKVITEEWTEDQVEKYNEIHREVLPEADNEVLPVLEQCKEPTSESQLVLVLENPSTVQAEPKADSETEQEPIQEQEEKFNECIKEMNEDEKLSITEDESIDPFVEKLLKKQMTKTKRENSAEVIASIEKEADEELKKLDAKIEIVETVTRSSCLTMDDLIEDKYDCDCEEKKESKAKEKLGEFYAEIEEYVSKNSNQKVPNYECTCITRFKKKEEGGGCNYYETKEFEAVYMNYIQRKIEGKSLETDKMNCLQAVKALNTIHLDGDYHLMGEDDVWEKNNEMIMNAYFNVWKDILDEDETKFDYHCFLPGLFPDNKFGFHIMIFCEKKIEKKLQKFYDQAIENIKANEDVIKLLPKHADLTQIFDKGPTKSRNLTLPFSHKKPSSRA
jgi:hypothetical protein